MRDDRVIAMAEPGDFKFVFDKPDSNYIEFVGGTLNIHLTADVNINCSNVKISTSGSLTINAGGTTTINTSGSTTIKSGGVITINGSRVNIN